MSNPEPSSIESFLDDFVASGEVTAAVGLVASASETLWTGASGHERIEQRRRATRETVFDLASITKTFVATLALRLDATGRLPLSTSLGELWGGVSPSMGALRLDDLLTHRSGLPAWLPMYALAESPDEVLERILATTVDAEPKPTYSDLGLFLWSRSAERALEADLTTLLDREVLKPLDLSGRIETAPGDRPEIAECACDTGKEVELAHADDLTIEPLGAPAIGQPQDGNSRWLASQGIELPGHAGLFGSVDALLPFARAWLSPDDWLGAQTVEAALARISHKPSATSPDLPALSALSAVSDPRRTDSTPSAPKAASALPTQASAATRDEFGEKSGLVGEGKFALGWWRSRSDKNDKKEGGVSGPVLSSRAFGHPGFAGGNLWIDPGPSGSTTVRDRGRIYILLAHRSAPESKLGSWRCRFHELASRAFAAR